MQKAFLTGVLAACLIAPAVVHAQPVPPAAASTSHTMVIRPSQILAVGAGAIVGAAVFEGLASSELGYLAGVFVGGYLAGVWYDDVKFEIHAGGAS